jgi:hypothetical protein
VAATAMSTTTANVTFTPPAGGSANTITYDLSGGGSYSLSETTFSVTGLTANTSYTFTVTATTTTNSTNASSSGFTIYNVVPTSISASNYGDQSSIITFSTASTYANSYIVYSYVDGSNTVFSSTTGSTSPITVSGLTTDTSYNFKVASVYAMYTGDSSILSNTVNVYSSSGLTISSNNITGFTGSQSNVIIPSTVRSIGAGAFANKTSIKKMYIGRSVTSISVGYAGHSFVNCSSINSLIIDASNTTYSTDGYSLLNIGGTILYQYITRESASYTIGNSITSLNTYAFYNCTGLTSLTLGTGITSIGANTFTGCTGLGLTINYASIADSQYYAYTGINNVILGPNVTSIATNAFNGCTGITSLTIGRGVTNISVGSTSHSFVNCSSINSFIIDASNTTYSTDGFSLLNKAGNIIYQYIKRTSASYDIGNSITSLNTYAFYNSSGLTSLTIGTGITSIGFYAFTGFSGLTLTINYASIAASQYFGSTGINNVILGPNVTSIDTNAFNGCTGITSVTIGSGVTSIAVNLANRPFVNCTSISTFIIDASNPNYSTDGYSLYNKNSTIFYNFITKTITSYVIPNTVTTMSQYAFNNCTSLTQITLPNTITTMGQYAFYGCTSLPQITLPNTITYINANSFYGCTNLTSVTMGTSVGTIAQRAFQNCSSLPNIEISNSVTQIDNNVFNGCSNMTSLIIPNSVTYIGDTIFKNCTNLTSLILGTGITSFLSNTVNGCNSLTTLTIPVSVTSISTNAVTNNSNLATIIFNGNYPTSINTSNSFVSNKEGCIGYYYPNKTGWPGTAITGITITSLLAITGTKTNGETLTATQYLSTIGATGLTYQWYSNASNSNSGGSAISGATSSTYVYDSTYAYVYIIVNYTLNGSSTSLTSNAF